MKKPRLLSMVLVVVMLLTCCFGTHLASAVAASNTEPTFTVTNGSGSPGDDVTVTVDISNNPGICTATIWVHYDEGLTLKTVTDGRLLVGPVFGGDKSANPYGLSWDDSANFDGDNSSNGTLVTLVFTVDANATNGDYDVWVTYNYGDIYNLDLDDFDFECVAGKITVTGGACSHSYTNYVSNNDATCQADGTKTATCDNGCGATDTVTDTDSKVAHKYTTYTPNNDATCEGDGTKTANCDYGCGTKDTLTIESSELGHSYTTYTSDGNATCEADGTKTATCDNGCGKTDTVEEAGSKIPHSFHNYTSNNDSTCFSDGTKTAYCEYGCGEKETVADTGSKKTHSYTNYASNNNATCMTNGTETAECDNGCGEFDTRDIEGSKLAHEYTNYVYQNDATYFADGTERATCAYNCGTTDTRTKDGSKLVDTILPAGEIKVKENGWKSFLNTISFGLFCKDKFDVTITAEDNETGIDTVEYYKSSTAISEDDIKNVTGWTSGKSFSVESDGQYIIYVKIADKAGNVAYISTDGIVVDTTAPVIGGVENGKSYCEAKTFTVTDTYLDVVTVNGVETANHTLTDGEYTIVATDKAENSVTVKVNVYDGHNYSTYTSNNDATCKADGTKTAICANGCGSTDTVTDTGSKTDHSYTNYVSNNDATCTADGTETAACDYNCGNSDTRTDANSKIAHKYTNYESNNDATCTANGTETAACDYNCGKSDTRTDVDSKLGHAWELTSTDPATCTEDGKEHYTCKIDSEHTKVETITAPGHTFGEWTVTKAATSTEVGEKTHSCTVADCGHKETVEIAAIVAEIVGVTDGVWEINKSESLSVKANGEFGDVLEVKVDGKVIDKNSYVVETEGSTITFKAEYLNALSAGKHNITVKYTDGETSTEIEVKAATTTEKDDTADSDTKSPQTGDNSNIVLWIIIACVSFTALFVLVFLSRRKVNHR